MCSNCVKFFLFFILFLFLGCDRNNTEPENVTKFDREVLARIDFDDPINLEGLEYWVDSNSEKVELVEVSLSFDDATTFSLLSKKDIDLVVDSKNTIKKLKGKFKGVKSIYLWTSKNFFYGKLTSMKGALAYRVDNLEYQEVVKDEKLPFLASWIPRCIEMNDEILLTFYFDGYNNFAGYQYLDVVVEIDQLFKDKIDSFWVSNLPGVIWVYDSNEENDNKFRVRVDTKDILFNGFQYYLFIPLKNNGNPLNLTLMVVTFDVVSGSFCSIKDGESACSYIIEHADFRAESSRSLKHGGKKRLPDIKYLF
ncbi:MAG: hypothetical protein CO137_01190 [Candidatus Magasanikbacteria bacterium CG_4_9_14_3_um_filter_32_9]|uniref:Lipoprotein n=1 Tax=Candidatus Magasanikbacteria bacterium CG_4_9_14_3_um_filter_32_9 TaxID=1974644 RepID=A0A2M7Z771_9BACT|nr:MAG: hypothetical protein CO137_01190 [Candidatus Magasanikbacteria bacterium CG_4_9_14_3_um_filter_32_9]